jgi:hypothetical protein
VEDSTHISLGPLLEEGPVPSCGEVMDPLSNGGEPGEERVVTVAHLCHPRLGVSGGGHTKPDDTPMRTVGTEPVRYAISSSYFGPPSGLVQPAHTQAEESLSSVLAPKVRHVIWYNEAHVNLRIGQ